MRGTPGIIAAARRLVAGTPTISAVAVAPNTWGDIRVTWEYTNYSGEFVVDLIDTNDSSIVASVTVYEAEAIFPVESILPHWGLIPSDFRVKITAGAVEFTWENTMDTANDDWVKQIIVFGGQSNMGGHLSFLSGTDGRVDLVSGGDIRRAVADASGLPYGHVMPVNLTYGDSAIEKNAEPDAPTGTNHWYDLDGAANGPRLTQFLSDVTPYAERVVAILWAQGETDCSGSYAGGSRSSTPQRYYDATNAVFTQIRTVVPATQSNIIFQIMARSFYNGVETDGQVWQTYRNKQRDLIGARPDVILGSWAPGAERLSGYLDGIHYTSAVYHVAAIDLIDSILNGTDRLDSPPVWVDMVSVTGLSASMSGLDQIHAWNAGAYTHYKYANLSVPDASVIYEGVLTTNSYNFTSAAQVAEYGFNSTSANFTVAGYDPVGDAQGPTTILYGDAAG